MVEDNGSVREEEQPLECIGYSTVMKEKLYSYTILLSVKKVEKLLISNQEDCVRE